MLQKLIEIYLERNSEMRKIFKLLKKWWNNRDYIFNGSDEE